MAPLKLKKPETIAPKKRGPTMNAVEREILRGALKLSEQNTDLVWNKWRTSKGAIFEDFDRGLLLAFGGDKLGAFGLWAIAHEAAHYARLLSHQAPERETYPVKQMMRQHRLLYAVAHEAFQKPFVGLKPQSAITVMSLALEEMDGTNGQQE